MIIGNGTAERIRQAIFTTSGRTGSISGTSSGSASASASGSGSGKRQRQYQQFIRRPPALPIQP